jgi:hypothetical protein
MMKLTNVFGQQPKSRKQVIKLKSGGNFISITSSNSSEFVLILYWAINVYDTQGQKHWEGRQRKSAEGSTLHSHPVLDRVQGNPAEILDGNNRAGQNTTGVHIMAL